MSINPLNIFISHHHEENLLANACQKLLTTVGGGRIAAWHSSDEAAKGGVTPGEWRDEIRKRLEEAQVILVLITPASNDKPWVFFESGFASGQRKEIIPICFFMNPDAVNSVFQSLQCYRGDCSGGPNGIMALCGKLIRMHQGTDPSEDAKEPWGAWIKKYLEAVDTEHKQSHTRNLFQDHFHNASTANRMAGKWFAKWTQQKAGEPEVVFEVDELQFWTTDRRLRVVGTSSKEGRDVLSERGQDAARFYPMEGVVSRLGHVALSYWSGGDITICGTCLLAPVGATGEVLEGTWQGFTAHQIQDSLSFTQGRVVIARGKDFVAGHWADTVVATSA